MVGIEFICAGVIALLFTVKNSNLDNDIVNYNVAIDEVIVDLNIGVVEVGTIERGKIKVGDTVEIVGLGMDKKRLWFP